MIMHLDRWRSVAVKKIIKVLTGTAISGVAVSAALVGAGVASAAPDVAGETYADASAAIEEEGGTVVVATRVGDKLEQGDCIVIGVTDASFVRPMSDDVYFEGDSDEIAVNLNCAGGVASATSPGASVASPAGREAISRAEEEAASDEEAALEETSEPDV
jgi:hypothetical protein